MKKNEVIKMVNESAGSLFTKEDVINLVSKVENGGSVDLEELCERVLAIVEDADTTDIEIDDHNTEFRVRNGNEIVVDSASFDANDYVNSIKHDIRELFASVEERDTEFDEANS